MSYSANQYNYATPLSSSSSLVGSASSVVDDKLFALSDNVLDGSYKVISGDVGLWGAAVSDADGNLSTPFVVTVVEDTTFNSFRLIGSQYVYPVAFTVKFYNGSTLLHTITETANNKAEYTNYLSKTLVVTSYEISITKVSKAGSAARLYNVYNPGYIKRSETLNTKISENSEILLQLYFSSQDTLVAKLSNETAGLANVLNVTDTAKVKESSTSSQINSTIVVNDSVKVKDVCSSYINNTIDVTSDTLKVKNNEVSAILNTIDVTKDTYKLRVREAISHVTNIFDVINESLKIKNYEAPILYNVHSAMKSPSRRVYGKVYITYTDPILETAIDIETSLAAYNSVTDQLVDGVYEADNKYFTLYDNDLSGKYVLSDMYSQVGWVSGVVSDYNGAFQAFPYVSVSFSARPIVNLPIYFDDSHGSVAEDFTVELLKEDGTTVTEVVTGNKERQVNVIKSAVGDVIKITIRVSKVTKPGYPVAILSIPVLSTVQYIGYQDKSDLVSIDLLEELTYDDEVEALGGMSANEVTVVIDNSKKDFFFNNVNSFVGKKLLRNRRIVPWLGTEVAPGYFEWYCLGTFWSYSWNVPVDGLAATVVGFDTIGLLDTTSYTNHQTLVNKSIGQLIEYVLTDAKDLFGFLEWKISDELYDVIVPYAWFEYDSHAAALRKICKSYPMHIYCDRDGRVCAAPQKLSLDFIYDTWANNTNVINTEYSSLYTALPNIVNVTVKEPIVVQGEELVKDTLVFNISDVSNRTLKFNKPLVGNLELTIDKDSGVSYTYNSYSWGVDITFTGTGSVRSIVCKGDALDMSTSSVFTVSDPESIRLNGAITRNVAADFIQTGDLASYIANRIMSLSEYDKYDAQVTYRGDISLTINDPIYLKDGIAPDNRYNIKRHQLSWNGALSGVADLNR